MTGFQLDHDALQRDMDKATRAAVTAHINGQLPDLEPLAWSTHRPYPGAPDSASYLTGCVSPLAAEPDAVLAAWAQRLGLAPSERQGAAYEASEAHGFAWVSVVGFGR